jgi:hypothetical protein
LKSVEEAIVSLRHRLFFNGASMAQPALRHHRLAPKEKAMAPGMRQLLVSNRAPKAQWRTMTADYFDCQ